MTNQTKIRESFIFYRSFYEAIKSLENEKKVEIYDAIFSYSFDQKEPNLSGVSASIFTLIRPQLDANRKRFENGCKEKKKSKKQAKDKQTKSKVEANNNVNHNHNHNLNEESKSKSKSESKFIKPALQEIQAYCQERKNNVNAEKFFDYYQANGWKVGKNPMKDWKAAVRTWEKNEKTTNNKEDFSIYSKY